MQRFESILTAIYRVDYHQLLKLLSQADVNSVDADGRTALMHAVLAEEPELRIVKLLIDHGADVNVSDTAGQNWTALHFAAQAQRADILGVLLNAGAIVDAKDVFGNTPLWRAVMTSEINPDVIRTLLRHGANPDEKNKHGVSPRDLVMMTQQEEILLGVPARFKDLWLIKLTDLTTTAQEIAEFENGPE